MRNETGPGPRVVDALVVAGLVDPARRTEADAVVTRALHGEGRPTSSRSMLVEIAGYVGGALVLAAFGLFLAQYWSDLSDAAQVVALAGITLVLAAAGVLVARIGGGYTEMRTGHDEVRRRLTSALLLAAAVAAGITVGRQVEVLQDGYSSWPGFAGGLVAAVLALGVYAVAPSALVQLVLAGASTTAIFSGLDLVDLMNDSTLWSGLALVALGAAWVAAVELGVFAELVVGRAIGAGLLLFGAQMVLFDGDHNALSYAVTAVVAVLGFVAYLRTTSWPYLAAGVVGVTLVVPEAVIDWTEGSLGAGGAVLVAGLTLLGASLAGFRMRQEVTEEDDATPATPDHEVSAPR